MSWNAGAEQIYGYSAAEVIGKNVSILIPPDMPDEVPELLQKIGQGERIAHYETVRVRKALWLEALQAGLFAQPVVAPIERFDEGCAVCVVDGVPGVPRMADRRR